MIKKYYNIITICVILMNVGSFLFPAGCSNCSRNQNNFEIVLNIINTPQFSFSNWNDPLVDLWSMTLINNQACATTPHYDSEVQIEMLLEDNTGEAMIWAVTDPLIVPCGGGSRILYNSDFLDEQVRNGLDQYLYNKVFHDDSKDA